MSVVAILAAALGLAVSPTLAQSSLPNPSLTPGVINPAVIQANIGETICVRGWTRTIRPPEKYTERLKRVQISEYGYADRRMRDYEEDHLIPLELAGAPTDPRNLWPEPRYPADGWTASKKDELEATLARLVCAGRIPLDEARRAIARDWRRAYARFTKDMARQGAARPG